MSNEQRKPASSPQASRRPPLILAIETATRTGSVCIARRENVLASVSGDPLSSHSTNLIENVDAVLRTAEVELNDVEVFAAATGPGSFTGLRIGLATVKSFAVALNRKCAAVPTLAAVAYAACKSERTVALLPAGRGELFAQMFSVNDRVEALDEPSHINPETLLRRYGDCPQIVWAGEGAQVQSETLRRGALERGISFHESGPSSTGWILAASHARLAEAVAVLAVPIWRSGSLVNAEDLHANYVRPSDAEIKSSV